jgi:hypothetical protein
MEGGMKLLTDEVSVGDRFIKFGDYSRTVYVVHSLVDARGFPQHARFGRRCGTRPDADLDVRPAGPAILVTGSRDARSSLAADVSCGLMLAAEWARKAAAMQR